MPRSKSVRTGTPARSPAAPDASINAIDELDCLDPDLLRRRWRSTMGRPAPPHLPRALMIRILFWREQVARSGDLKPATLAMLATLSGKDTEGAQPVPPPPSHSGLKPGTLLAREYAGRMHRVMALDNGFSWNGQTYRSLSEVALAITGTIWNGPRFFGLRKTTLAGKKGSGIADPNAAAWVGRHSSRPDRIESGAPS